MAPFLKLCFAPSERDRQVRFIKSRGLLATVSIIDPIAGLMN